MSVNYAELAISHVKFYLSRLENAISNCDPDMANRERKLMEMELLEIFRAFQFEYSDKRGLCASFWDFITELQNTPGNYNKSLSDLMNRS